MKTWWLLHLPPQTTLILHFVLKVYFRVPCHYHNKQPNFPYTTFTGHFSNGLTVVFSSKCEQAVCSTQAKGCAVTCQADGGPVPHTISPLEGSRWSLPHPGRFSTAKRPSTLRPGLDGCAKSPHPQGVQTLHQRARTESLHDCAIVAAGPLYITQVNFSPQMRPSHRSEIKGLVVDLSPRRTWFDPCSVHVGFVVDKVALAQVYLRLLRLHTLRIIPSVLHTHLHHDMTLQKGQSGKTCDP